MAPAVSPAHERGSLPAFVARVVELRRPALSWSPHRTEANAWRRYASGGPCRPSWNTSASLYALRLALADTDVAVFCSGGGTSKAEILGAPVEPDAEAQTRARVAPGILDNTEVREQPTQLGVTVRRVQTKDALIGPGWKPAIQRDAGYSTHLPRRGRQALAESLTPRCGGGKSPLPAANPGTPAPSPAGSGMASHGARLACRRGGGHR